MFYKPFIRPNADETHLLKVSRLFVIFWGAVLALMAWQFSATELDIVTLAFSMTTYTWGPMLGLFLLSMLAVRYRVSTADTLEPSIMCSEVRTVLLEHNVGPMV